MTITEQMSHLSQVEFWLFFLLASAIALSAFYFAFRYITLARLVEDTPTANIHFAQQGYVELSGAAMALDGNPIAAPLSGRDCCWYHYKIEKKGNKSWRMVEQQSSTHPFLLKDDSGFCRIDPEGARVTTGEHKVWYGNSRYPESASAAKNSPGNSGWRMGSPVCGGPFSSRCRNQPQYEHQRGNRQPGNTHTRWGGRGIYGESE